MQLQINTKIHDPNRDLLAKRKYVYRLKFCDINRFSDTSENMHKTTKCIRWVTYEESLPDHKSKQFKFSTLSNSKSKTIRFPFKFKYLKQDLILEVSSCLDTRSKALTDNLYESQYDLRNVETLIYKAQYSFEELMPNRSKWIEPVITSFK